MLNCDNTAATSVKIQLSTEQYLHVMEVTVRGEQATGMLKHQGICIVFGNSCYTLDA